MLSLLRRKNEPVEADTAPVVEPGPPEIDCVLLLVPEGAFGFRVAGFDDVKSAAFYVDAFLVPGQAFHSVWLLDPRDTKSRTSPGEALVLVREEERQDVFQPYSFADAETALAFIEQDLSPTTDRERILFFWAEGIDVPRGRTDPVAVAAAAPARQAAAQRRAPGGNGLQIAVAGAGAGGGGAGVVVEPKSPGLFSRVLSWPGWDGLGPLMVGASMGKRQVYDEALDSDDQVERRAALIVAAGAAAAAFGGVGSGQFAPFWHLLGVVFGWCVAACVIYFASKTLVPGQRPENSGRRLLTALGLAFSPALLFVLGAVPIFGPLFSLAVLIWLAGTMVIAVISAMEMETESAIIVASTGWVTLFALALVAPAVLV